MKLTRKKRILYSKTEKTKNPKLELQRFKIVLHKIINFHMNTETKGCVRNDMLDILRRHNQYTLANIPEFKSLNVQHSKSSNILAN